MGEGLRPRAEEETTLAVVAGGAGGNDLRKPSIPDEWAAGLDDCNDLFRPQNLLLRLLAPSSQAQLLLKEEG